MRTLNKSRIEIYVENYLRTKPSKTAKGLNFLRKAKAYIDYAVFYNECDFSEPVLNLYTLQDNQFTKTVYHMIRNIGLSYYKRSLERTSELLNKYINQ